MKKWIVIFLLFGLLFNTTGYYFSFILTSASAKAKAWMLEHEKEGGEELVYLHFNLINGQPRESEVDFINETEFIYQGNLYDLVSRTDYNGIAHFKCYSDKKEADAIASLGKSIEAGQRQPCNDHNSSPLKDLLKYYFDSSSPITIIPPAPSAAFYAHTNTPSAGTPLYSVITPPPDFYLS